MLAYKTEATKGESVKNINGPEMLCSLYLTALLDLLEKKKKKRSVKTTKTAVM